jgi:hypothetical protein
MPQLARPTYRRFGNLVITHTFSVVTSNLLTDEWIAVYHIFAKVQSWGRFQG